MLEAPKPPHVGAMTCFVPLSALSPSGQANPEVPELEMDATGIDSAYRALDSLYQDARGRLDGFDRSLKSLQRGHQELEKERQALARERSELANQRAGADDSAAVEQLQRQLASLQETHAAELAQLEEKHSSLVAAKDQELGHAKDQLDEQTEQLNSYQAHLTELRREKDTAAGLAQAAISDAARREKDLEHKLEGAKADLAGLSKLLVAAQDEGGKREAVIRGLKDKLQEAHKQLPAAQDNL